MKKIFRFLQRLWTSSQALVKKYVRPSVEVVNAIKFIINSPVVPIITAVIPGSIDDVIAAQIKLHLPTVLKVLGYADECVHAGSGDAIFQCAISKIRLMKDEGRDAAFHSIASLLSKYLADGRLSWREALHLAEETFHELGNLQKAA